MSLNSRFCSFFLEKAWKITLRWVAEFYETEKYVFGWINYEIFWPVCVMKILLRCTSILKLSTGENNYTYCWKDFVFCLDFFSKPYHSFDMHIEKEKNRCAKNTGFAVRGDMPDLSATISFFDAFPCNILSNFFYIKKKLPVFSWVLSWHVRPQTCTWTHSRTRYPATIYNFFFNRFLIIVWLKAKKGWIMDFFFAFKF